MLYAVIKCLLGIQLGLKALHGKSLLALLAGTYVRAGAAAKAVKHGYGYRELISGHAGKRKGLSGYIRCFCIAYRNGTDTCMRTYIGAEVTLDTVIGIPGRNIDCHAALLVCGGT